MSAPPTAAPEATAPPAAWPAAPHARESHTVTAERDRYVRERLNFQVFTLGRATQAVALVAAVLLWGAFYWATRDVRVLVWAALVHCAQALRYAGFAGTARRYPASRYPDALPSEAIRHVLPLLLMTSCAWGAAPWLLTPANGAHDAQLPVLAIFLFGMIAGSIPAIMPMPALVAVWLVPLTLSLSARFAWVGSAQGWTTAIGALLFAATMARFALAQRRLLVAELRGQLEREELTAELVTRTRELQRLNQERSRFFAAASHDLRQPVHAMSLMVEAISLRNADPGLQPLVADLRNSMQAMSQLFNALLNLSRLESGQPLGAKGAVDLSALLADMVRLFREQASLGGLALRLRLPRGGATVWAEPVLLRQALANLVQNAIRYTPQGKVLVSVRARGSDWLVEVDDTDYLAPRAWTRAPSADADGEAARRLAAALVEACRQVDRPQACPAGRRRADRGSGVHRKDPPVRNDRGSDDPVLAAAALLEQGSPGQRRRSAKRGMLHQMARIARAVRPVARGRCGKADRQAQVRGGGSCRRCRLAFDGKAVIQRCRYRKTLALKDHFLLRAGCQQCQDTRTRNQFARHMPDRHACHPKPFPCAISAP